MLKKRQGANRAARNVERPEGQFWVADSRRPSSRFAVVEMTLEAISRTRGYLVPLSDSNKLGTNVRQWPLTLVSCRHAPSMAEWLLPHNLRPALCFQLHRIAQTLEGEMIGRTAVQVAAHSADRLKLLRIAHHVAFEKHGFIYMYGDDVAKDRLAGGGAVAERDDLPQGAFDVDRAFLDEERLYLVGRQRGQAAFFELTDTVFVFGAANIHVLGDRLGDGGDDELLRCENVRQRVLRFAVAIEGRAEDHDRGVGPEHVVEGERSEVGPAIGAERRCEGDGPRLDEGEI